MRGTVKLHTWQVPWRVSPEPFKTRRTPGSKIAAPKSDSTNWLTVIDIASWWLRPVKYEGGGMLSSSLESAGGAVWANGGSSNWLGLQGSCQGSQAMLRQKSSSASWIEIKVSPWQDHTRRKIGWNGCSLELYCKMHGHSLNVELTSARLFWTYKYMYILIYKNISTNHLYSRNKIPSNEFELHLPLVSYKFPTPHPKRTQMIKLEQCLAWIAQNVSSTSNWFQKVTLSG